VKPFAEPLTVTVSTVAGGLVGATAERAVLDSSAALTGAAAAASSGIAAAKRGRLPSRVWLPTGDGPGLAMSRFNYLKLHVQLIEVNMLKCFFKYLQYE
jgi:hypothetical protein